jgi:hypothetical protein
MLCLEVDGHGVRLEGEGEVVMVMVMLLINATIDIPPIIMVIMVITVMIIEDNSTLKMNVSSDLLHSHHRLTPTRQEQRLITLRYPPSPHLLILKNNPTHTQILQPLIRRYPSWKSKNELRFDNWKRLDEGERMLRGGLKWGGLKGNVRRLLLRWRLLRLQLRLRLLKLKLLLKLKPKLLLMRLLKLLLKLKLELEHPIKLGSKNILQEHNNNNNKEQDLKHSNNLDSMVDLQDFKIVGFMLIGENEWEKVVKVNGDHPGLSRGIAGLGHSVSRTLR